ncbi:kinesin light chain 1 [Pyrenochaeta sp. MPI-SDFR-AT-0127]|nr:kinesin light chain 1 [Pyrenochaeta sp. MPI-SDFR-AT-0127]
MRLLKRLSGGGFELIIFENDHPPPYAILSHTWVDGQEVTYDEFVAGRGKDKIGYDKICFCGERAAADDLEYFWVDTCCIDKSNNNELSTAINYMFRWYQRASKCYVYLSDVSIPDEVTDAKVSSFPKLWQEAFRRSRWFTRGWTLQELLAPASLEFFCKQGKRLGSSVLLEQEIHEITKIPIPALRGQRLSEFSVEDRMSWAAKRTTTLKEDKVYCLLGIFGVFLPLIYGEGEEYATLRLEEEIQKRQKGLRTNSSRNPSIFSSLPFQRNELFVGRTDELHSLERHLLVPNSHRRMTIYGLGGCGKSALAIEFAYRVLAGHAKLVFWVPAINQESFMLAYREIGKCLRIPGISDDNADIKRLVQETLDSERVDNWLMIVDNADDREVLLGTTDSNLRPARLRDYLPKSARGAILFTTRNRKVADALTQSNVLELNHMDKGEARQLLTQRITKQTLLNDEAAISKLLQTLTWLPLALVQAAAFMINNDVSVSTYLSLLQDAGAEIELFNERFEDPSRYEELDSTIAKTWHVSFDQMRKQDPLAAEYFSFMACIDRVNIPQSILPLGASAVQHAKALGTLTGYAFITERLQTGQEPNRERIFDMHRLVHIASIWWLERHNERAAWVDTAMTRLQELVPNGGHRSKMWSAYLPHAIQVARTHGVVGKAASALLLHRVGKCQERLGQYAAAETTHRYVLSVRENVLGPEEPDTLTSMDQLAGALSCQGKYAEAAKLHRETLELRKKVLGDEHPQTLVSMDHAARELRHLGKYAEAEEMHRNELELSKKVLGNNHPDTLTSMNNVAKALGAQGKYAEAEKLYRETLKLRKKVSGEEHPDTLTSTGNLAKVLSDQGKYTEAEVLHRETLKLIKKVFGEEHPDTLTSLNNIARALGGQGKYAEAEKMHRETLTQRKKVSGEEHPYTLTSMDNLAGVLGNQGKYAEAEKMYWETLELRKKVLGVDHPVTRASDRHYHQMLALLEQKRIAPGQKPESSVDVRSSKKRRLM